MTQASSDQATARHTTPTGINPRPLRRWSIACGAVALAVAAACGGSGKPAATAPSTTMTISYGAPSSTQTMVTRFEVPVPAGAEPGSTNRSDSMAFRFHSMTIASLAAFYDTQMPMGQNWHGLKWCPTTSVTTPDHGYWRSYLDSSNTSLVVATSVNADGSAGLTIGTQADDGGAC